jgi:hypothetical protein
MNENPPKNDPLRMKLRMLWRRQRLHIHMHGLAWAFLFLPPLLLVLFGLDRMLDLPRVGRWSFLLLALAMFAWQGAKRWFFRLKPFDELNCAGRVEKHFPQFGSLLINYVQIASSVPKASGSDELLGLVKRQAIQASQSIDFGQTVDFNDLKASLKLTFFSITVFLLSAIFFGNSMSVAMKRYLGWNLPYPTETILIDIPDHRTVAKGTKLTLAIGAKGKVPDNGSLYLRSDRNEPWRQIIIPINENGSFAYSINKVEQSFAYFFEIGDATSHPRREPAEVTVVSAPIVIAQRLAVSPPPYTALPSYETKSLSSAVPEGSQLTWVPEISSPIMKATLNGPGGLVRSGQVDEKGSSVTFSWTAEKSGVHQLAFKESKLGIDFQGPLYTLNLRKDQEPRLSLISPVSDIKATAKKKLELIVRASDDYGLSEFAILYRVNGEKNRHRISLGAPPANDSQKDLRHPRSGTWPLLWNFQNDLPNLNEGDLIEIAVEITEVAPNPESARKALSRTCSVEILSVSEYQAYITTRFNDLQSDLAETERRELLIKHAIQASGNQ